MLKIALVGKQNVGKSTIFNRIIRHKKAIVSDFPGVTRDRIHGIANWLDKEFIVIDTGGLTNNILTFRENIEQQVKYAIDEANLILFIVSAKDGINNDDYYVAKLLKKYKNKDIILVINKAENIKKVDNIYYSLGFKEPILISAEHSIGMGDLLDKIITYDKKKNNIKEESFSFCIIGKTNVGKSTLLNAVVNEERVIVSPIEHTTRDSIDVDFKYNNKNYTIVDTAGIRRKGKIKDDIEKFAIMRTEGAIQRSELIILMLDGSKPFDEQDKIIGGLAYKANIPTIICVNKWDVAKQNEKKVDEVKKIITKEFQYLSWAPIIFISAKEKKHLHTIFSTIEKIREQAKMNVSTSMLNRTLAQAEFSNNAPKIKGDRISISYATQVKGKIPTFVIFVNNPDHLHFSYARYIENKIRDAFGIDCVPITLYYKSKNARIRTKKDDEHVQ